MEVRDLTRLVFFQTATIFQKSLGIYRTDKEVHVCLLEKKLNSIHHHKYQIYYLEERSFENILDIIASEIETANVQISYYYTNPGSLFKVIRIPTMPEKEIAGWLDENWAQALKANIPKSRILFDYKILSKENDLLLFCYMVNSAEIDTIYQQFKHAGLTISHFNLLANSTIKIDKKQASKGILNLRDGAYDLYIYKGRSLQYFNQIPKAIHKDQKEAVPLINLVNQLYQDDLNLLDFNCTSESIQIKNSLENNPEDVARQTALSALVSPDSALQIAPEVQNQQNDENFWKQAALKTTLGLGGIFIILYIIAFVINLGFMGLQSGLQDDLDALAPDLARLESIRNQLKMKNNDLREVQRMKSRRSNSAIALAAISAHIPEDCWLTHIHYDQNSEGLYNGFVTGMSRKRQAVNDLLNHLEDDAHFTKTNLDYVQRMESDYLYRTWKVRSANYLEFKLSFRMQ